MRAELRVVQIPSADSRKEDLPFESELRCRGDQTRNRAELLAETRIGKGRGERWISAQDARQHGAVRNRVRREPRESRLEKISALRREQIVLGTRANSCRGRRA